MQGAIIVTLLLGILLCTIQCGYFVTTIAPTMAMKSVMNPPTPPTMAPTITTTWASNSIATPPTIASFVATTPSIFMPVPIAATPMVNPKPQLRKIQTLIIVEILGLDKLR